MGQVLVAPVQDPGSRARLQRLPPLVRPVEDSVGEIEKGEREGEELV